MIPFTIVNAPSTYNVILGHLTLSTFIAEALTCIIEKVSMCVKCIGIGKLACIVYNNGNPS